jgi:hypothetical protein
MQIVTPTDGSVDNPIPAKTGPLSGFTSQPGTLITVQQ